MRNQLRYQATFMAFDYSTLTTATLGEHALSEASSTYMPRND
jgi:hypothetical protein